MILREKELKEKLIEGVNLVGDVVGSTLGPKGRLVLIEDNGVPYITKDGVTVTKAMSHEDSVVNSAIELLKQVAEKTVKDAGDGTTTSIVLAKNLITNGIKAIGECDNIIDFFNGFDNASKAVVETITGLAKPVETIDQAKNVALVSANNDKEISELIGEALNNIGLKGNIHVVKNGVGKTYLDVTKGFKFAKGMASIQLLNKEGKCVLKNPVIIIYNGDLMHFNPVQDLLQDVYERNGCVDVLLLAHTFNGSVIDNCILNKNQGILNIYPVEAPSFGSNRNNILEDICVLTSTETELPTTITEPLFGMADKVIITKDSTTIFGVYNQENLDYRIEKLENEITECDDIIELQVLKERVSNLKQNVATLYIGGLTDSDTNERADRIEDAVCAVKSAVEEGVVEGGGNTYNYCATNLEFNREIAHMNRSYSAGYNTVIDSLISPFRQLCENSKYDILKADTTGTKGVDFRINKSSNLMENGIIDSAKACRVAFENAIAVTKVFLNIDSFVKI